MTCNEQNYELIGSITAYLENDIQFTRPFFDEKKYLGESFYSIANPQSKIVIPIKPETGALKETPGTDENGTYYDVTVTCDVEEVGANVYDDLDLLKKNVSHLIIKTFPNNDMVVRSADYAYSFDYHENGGVLSLEWNIRNKVGAQRVL